MLCDVCFCESNVEPVGPIVGFLPAALDAQLQMQIMAENCVGTGPGFFYGDQDVGTIHKAWIIIMDHGVKAMEGDK